MGKEEKEIKEQTENQETKENEDKIRKEDKRREEEQIEGEDKKVRKSRKEKKPRKGSRVGQKLLGVLQHLCLVVLAIAVCVVAECSTIRVSTFNHQARFNMYSQSRVNSYEDSAMFTTIFGYALSDIVRHGVVSSQLETNGSFDGRKIIDVTAYNYRQGDLPQQYVTAHYYLDDLLKWSSYGFEWSATDMTQTQAENFLADKTRVTIIDPDKYYNTSDTGYLKSDLISYTFVSDVSANELWVDMDDYDGFVDGYGQTDRTVTYSDTGEILTEVVLAEQPDQLAEYDSTETYASATTEAASELDEVIRTYNLLVNRYKTTEGMNLEEYVSDWDLYYDLCSNVQMAAKGLTINYEEYLSCNEYYSMPDSNVRYMIMKTVGEDTQIFTNLTDEQACTDVAEFMAYGGSTDKLLDNASDKYVYYSPADRIYNTNTIITEDTVRQILQGYDYAYPETVKIWFSVDTMYPANDGFRQGFQGFSTYMPYLWQAMGMAAIAGILYLLIWFYLTCVTGRDVDEEGRRYIRLRPFDEIPTEGAVLLTALVGVLTAFVFAVVIQLADLDPSDFISITNGVTLGYQWFGVAFGVGVFVADCLAMLFYYSFVRRIKARTLWKNSYLRRLFKRMTRFAWKVYDNGDIVLRTWLPYGAFLLFNFTMLLFFFVSMDNGEVFGIIVTLAFVAVVDILVGNLLYRNAKEQQRIVKGIETIAGGQLEHQVETDNLHGDNLILANSVNSIGQGIKEAVEISMKDERMKADLITNVSHDIKTPLTSIINYVDLIKREQVDNEKIKNYINVLDEKSQRLKQLTDDLVEASKISSGNISLSFEKINLTELMNQTIGEFSEKFEQKRLTTVMNINVQNAIIEADSRRIWRVIENLFNNIFKYAMAGTRVYLTVDSIPDRAGYITLSVKNISESPLNCDPDELTERFIRGDESRTTEGSGLGLSIAKNLTEAQKGTFEIQLDGDLFKVILTFPLAEEHV